MDASEILNTLNAAAASPVADLKEEDRLACLEACARLQETLENPMEALIRFLFGAQQGAALRLGVDMKLLEKGVAAKGPITIKQLAAEVSADRELVWRVMRMLAAMKLFQETAKDTYVANPLAAAFVQPSPLEAAVVALGCTLPSVALLPDYFAEKGYQSPENAFDGPWQYSRHTKDHYFDWMARRPQIQQAFNTLMTISRQGRGEEWFDFYPVEEKLSAQSTDEILLVDIGGNIGHDVVAFKNRFPNLPGKLIVEDLPNVVASAPLRDGIEAVGHNFFDPQPPLLKNAKAYYLRTVLHDWPNKQAKTILEHIRNVMSKDSILLINENAIPDRNVPLYQAQGDLAMMACFSALDRTEQQFAELLDSAGFDLVKVWRPEIVLPMSAVLFEAVIKQ
ncbi:S-adenosyl-L-methionine-dependent methyltransferase [Periconia macrospinosa]|uniref:S-adenosyl-L-methionine-dependent methyltransferase n=1 Tax=Periconia macrospinosa TaxID=97972 RepID=A0A2V1EDN5_9PLEO|nr:S-adenosyl-L-methionine-dependent methyltransferase [Periconia macrospinosa]